MPWVPGEGPHPPHRALLPVAAARHHVGAPLSSPVVRYADGLFGRAGRPAMFLVKASPHCPSPYWCGSRCPNGPRDAEWLTEQEREALAEVEPASQQHSGGGRAVRECPRPRTLVLRVACFGIIYGRYALGFFLPSIVGPLIPRGTLTAAASP